MSNSESIKIVRKGVFLSLLIYGFFGLLDYFMLPVNFKTAWLIRYAFLIPVAAVSMTLSFHSKAEKFTSSLMYLMLSAGVIGILLMIAVSEPSEPAFYVYFVGLTMMILACEFIFMMNIKTTTIFFALTETAYILVAVLVQHLHYRWLAGSIFFMTFTGVISMMGTAQIYREINNAQHLRHQAEKANRMKTSFLTNISHEIRTPLNGIIGYSQLIASDRSAAEENNMYPEIIRQCGLQLTETVDSIIDIAEIESGHALTEITNFQLRPFIRDISRVFSVRASTDNIDFKVSFTAVAELTNISTDIHKLRVLLNNLLSNAFKFTNEGSVVLECEKRSDLLIITVKDTGIGIAEENLSEIFVPFFQVNSGYERKYRGNGLGLSICKSYAELLGGSIEVKSSEGKGSTFTLSLPV